MFGNSSWTNPQQNQQQQQPQQQQGTSAFGQPNAFGTGGTGAFGGFGQNNQQQPPANPMFGNAAANTANPSGTSGFGTFGNSTSAFGAPKPTGFGAFGGGGAGTSAFGGGGTSAFGQTNTNSTGATFGQPQGTTGAFGGTGGAGGLFGQKPAAPTVGFGSTSTGPNTASGEVNVAPVTTGSSNPPFQAVTEKDVNGSSSVTLHYQSISVMPAYRGSSFEEIRVQDYAQGRKTAGGFGQSATFGLNQPSQPSATTFGQPAASTSAFGAFGQNNQQNTTQPANTFGAFAQPAASQPTGFGTGTGTSAFGTFGQPNNQQQQQPASGAFGSGTGAFGQTNNQQPQQTQPTGGFGVGAFGQNTNQPKPFGAFGSTTGTSAFGSFGQNNSQQPGQPNQPGTTGNLFGQPSNQTQATTNPFGGFGTNNNANGLKPSVFGQPAQQPATGLFGAFGQNQQNQQQQQQQQQQQPSTGLFGGTTGTGLFGQNNQQQGQAGQPQNQAQPSTGLFGQQPAQPASTGLFGTGGANPFGNNNQNKSQFGTGLFASTNNQPNSGAAQPQASIFGQPFGQSTSQSAPGTNAFGSTSLFGQKPAGLNAFGQSTTQPSASGLGNTPFSNSTLGGVGGGFGSSIGGVGGAQGTGTLTASIAQPVQTNLPIFSLLQTGPQSTSVDPPPKKMSSYFVDVPTRSPFGLSSSRLGGGKLRGFGYSQSAAGLTRNNGLSSTMTLSTSAPSPLALSRGGSVNLLGPEAFLGNSTLGGDGKPSPKKLVLDKKMDPSDVFGRAGAKNASANGFKATFNPAMSMAAREKELFSNPSPQKSTPTAAAASPAFASPGKKATPLEKDENELQEGDYYVNPSLVVLRSLSNGELSSFEGLVVGRKGVGEVHFLDPVDLTALPRLSALLGRLVQIDNKEVCVYPESVEGDDVKPPPGEGINVRARITLFGCWPVDKASREAITDEKHPAFVKHVKRLRTMKRTYFEGFDVKTGTWTFVVDHF